MLAIMAAPALADSHGKKKPELLSGASGAMLAASCNGCHGPDGVSVGPGIPSIGGQSVDYMVSIMQGFAKGEVPSTIMGRIAKGYTADEIKNMAAYYSKKPFVPAKQKFDAAQAKTGAKLHAKYCEKCHEDGGKKAEEDSGILAGQWLPYLHFTMADFLSGKREMTKKMRKKVKKLLDKEGKKGLEALFHYYASQQ